jgi:hypothetical protein
MFAMEQAVANIPTTIMGVQAEPREPVSGVT